MGIRPLIASLTLKMSCKLTYVLPFRRSEDTDLEELSSYVAKLAEMVDELIVVDGSDEEHFSEHQELWASVCTHVPPRPGLSFANGKVDGVFTGIELAAYDKVVIADDDVRYDAAALTAMEIELEHAELVRPQNYFDPAPWHAQWDTARTLLNRAFASDYPGTLGVQRAAFLGCGGYDGNTMFENLELIRTIEANGGRPVSRLDLYVRREPPTTTRFWSQRSRQAFDDLAQPWRLVGFLALGPLLLREIAFGRARRAAAILALPVALAEVGRRRAGGRRYFSPTAPLYAPLWILERSVCVWLALGMRARGGVPYRDGRIKVAANPKRRIRKRLQEIRGRSRL